MNTIHVGNLITERLQAEERSANWLAKKLKRNRSVVHNLLQRPTIDTGELQKISKILKFNFFECYYQAVEACLLQK